MVDFSTCIHFFFNAIPINKEYAKTKIYKNKVINSRQCDFCGGFYVISPNSHGQLAVVTYFTSDD